MRRSPYGGFVTTVPRTPSDVSLRASVQRTETVSATPARRAASSAMRTHSGSMSPADARKFVDTSFARASSLASRQSFSEKAGKSSAAKERFIPGATFFIIIAASIAIVPEPQNGSQKSTFSLGRANDARAAARVSRRGAETVSGRYPRL